MVTLQSVQGHIALIHLIHLFQFFDIRHSGAQDCQKIIRVG